LALKPLQDPKGWMDLLPTAEDYAKFRSAMGGAKGSWGGGVSPYSPEDPIQQKLDQAEAALKDWRTAYLTGVVNFEATLKLPPFVSKVAYQTSCFANKQGCLVQ
jgi:hypothetical protein